MTPHSHLRNCWKEVTTHSLLSWPNLCSTLWTDGSCRPKAFYSICGNQCLYNVLEASTFCITILFLGFAGWIRVSPHTHVVTGLWPLRTINCLKSEVSLSLSLSVSLSLSLSTRAQNNVQILPSTTQQRTNGQTDVKQQIWELIWISLVQRAVLQG